MYSGGLAQLGFVEGVPAVSVEQRRNHPGDFNYHTDGLRAVFFLVTRPLSLPDVEVLDWVPALDRQAAEAAENKPQENTDVPHAH